jgi:hypothetical protein
MATQTKTIAMVLLIAIATIGAIGIGLGTATQSAQAQIAQILEANPGAGNPHFKGVLPGGVGQGAPGEPTGNPHQFPTCSGNPHGQYQLGRNPPQCPGAQ